MGLWTDTLKGGTRTTLLDGHQCCYKHCNEPAIVVMVEAPMEPRTHIRRDTEPEPTPRKRRFLSKAAA